MNRNTNSDTWNQIIEDALHSIIQQSSNTDISGSAAANLANMTTTTSDGSANGMVPPLTNIDPGYSSTTLPPSGTMPSFSNNSSRNMFFEAPITPQPLPQQQHQQHQQHQHDRLNDFVMDWMDNMTRYHNNMRQYHHNMNQFNRMANSILAVLSYRETRPVSPPRPVFTFPTTAASNSQTSPTVNRQPDLAQTIFHSLPISLQEMIERTPGHFEIQGISVPLQQESQPIFPTITQIYEATEVFTYNDDTSSRVSDTRCPITLEDFEYGEELCQIRHCRHIFKWTSLQRWFSRNTHCPVCRHNIV